MKKMKLGTIGMKVKLEVVYEESINLPIGTEILSVQAKNSTMWINYMYPTESYSDQTYQKFLFIIGNCSRYAEIEIDEHQYIGNVDIGNNTYSIFYKKGVIQK